MDRRTFRRQKFVTPQSSTTSTKTLLRFRLPPLIPTVGLITVVVLSVYLATSPRFRIQTIVIDGTLNDVVAHDLDALKGKHILLLRTSSLEAALPVRQPSIRSLRLIKGFPDTLKVEVEVREPVLTWRVNDEQYYVDESGVIFTYEGQTPPVVEDLPEVTDARGQAVELRRKIAPRSFVRFVVELNRAFQDRIGIGIGQMIVGETTRHLLVETDGGPKVFFDTSRTLDPQLSTLSSTLDRFRSEIHESVDLRVEGKVFYR